MSCFKIVEISSFPPAKGGGGKILSTNLSHHHFSSCMREKSETILKNNLGNCIYYYAFLSCFCQ
ncbi:MAG: hypothetical protein LBR79_00400 [Oscillospiraceae bacterium]|nr:hypothetical protein [Oscillospiraceae bacterium]